MKTFKERIVKLIDTTKLDSVKESCKGIFETSLPDNDPSLRKIILENLNKIKQHSSLIVEFIRVENRIDELNDIGINEALSEILQPNILNSNPFLATSLNQLKVVYDNKTQPVTYIVEHFLNTVKPFDYLPQVDKHIKKITSYIAENNESLSLLRGKLILQNNRNNSLYGNILEMIDEYVYLGTITRNELMNEMNKYQFEPTMRELVTILQKHSDNKNEFLLKENSNFSVKPINSFIFVNEDKSKTFYHNGVFYNLENNKFGVLSEEKYNQLPSDYIQISKYLSSGKTFVNENTLTIKLGKETIAFKQHPDGTNKAFLNEKEINGNEPRAFLAQCGLFTSYGNDLVVINKIWENFSTLINIDFGKEIYSNKFTGLSATLFKLNEDYYVHLTNPAMNVNNIKEGTCLQVRNEILEHMGYDISETLYEFLEGDQAEIAKLRKTQEDIQNAIELLNEQFKKIDIVKQKNLLPVNKLEESGIIKTINEQIEALKAKYNDISVAIIKLQNTSNPSTKIDHNVTGGKNFDTKFTPYKNFSPKYNVSDKFKNKLQNKIDSAKKETPIGESELNEGVMRDIGAKIVKFFSGQVLLDFTDDEKKLITKSFPGAALPPALNRYPNELTLNVNHTDVVCFVKQKNDFKNGKWYTILYYNDMRDEQEFKSKIFAQTLDQDLKSLQTVINDCKQKMNESDVDSIVKDDGSLKVNDQVKVKSSGIVAKVTGINGVTGMVSLLTDEGTTLELPKDALEIIKDELASKLSDIEKVAKKASDELKGKMSEDFKSFEIEKGGTGFKFKIKPKVTTAEPNTNDDIIKMAKDAAKKLNSGK